ncbi:Dihydroorotate dehydrogenase (quinone), mitochondrial [Elasticomyces elasticus]|nr:Dihydroorotate dehydrogenase (quinone), mitochondrial [Elasticomyces elasticus]
MLGNVQTLKLYQRPQHTESLCNRQQRHEKSQRPGAGAHSTCARASNHSQTSKAATAFQASLSPHSTLPATLSQTLPPYRDRSLHLPPRTNRGPLFLTLTYLYITDTRASVHRYVSVPLLRLLYADAEDAHEAGTKYLKALYTFGLHPRERGNQDATGDLSVEVFGHKLDNPIGTSAGIDKGAEIPDALLAIGPAVVEVGGATPLPQEGNPKPRVFRIPSQNALINRYGLNSPGAAVLATRLRQRVREFAYSVGLGLDEEAERRVLDGEAGVPPGSLVSGKLMAVQVAKNKSTPDADIEAVKRDYVVCVNELAKYADIIVVNVSSPNTPGLRDLQRVGPLTNILTGVVDAAKQTQRKSKPAVMVKVSPDEDSEEQVSGICDAVWESGVDGIIVGNTTKRRPDPGPKGHVMQNDEASLLLEQGGYSGPELFERTVALVKRYRKTLDEGSRSQPAPAPSPPKFDSQKSAETDPETLLSPTQLDDSTKRDEARLKPLTAEAEEASKQPLIQLPEHNSLFSSDSSSEKATAGLSASHHAEQGKESAPAPSLEAPSQKEKVIFATGGITNGKQALDVLNAGASVAMVYTALVYGGVGTVSRIKEEIREEIGSQQALVKPR